MVAQLLDVETEQMMERFPTGVYWMRGMFDGRMLPTDLLDFMEAIAKVDQRDSPKPFLETNLESMFQGGEPGFAPGDAVA